MEFTKALELIEEYGICCKEDIKHIRTKVIFTEQGQQELESLDIFFDECNLITAIPYFDSEEIDTYYHRPSNSYFNINYILGYYNTLLSIYESEPVQEIVINYNRK